MDQMTTPALGRGAGGNDLTDFVVAAIDAAKVDTAPFYHLELGPIFPEPVYAAMLEALPERRHYRSMHGRSKADARIEGAMTRVKTDLFPEYIRGFAPEHRAIWRAVGETLRSEPVKQAFRRKLAPALEKRFGPGYAGVGMYPIPVLTRDITGYRIPPHTDTHWKGITVQLYLPPDEANTDIGTIFHSVAADGSMPKAMQMRFAPNSGYAFAVHDDTWHSVDVVHDRVVARDSILLTYFVDQGPLRYLRNRGKRLGNLIKSRFVG